MWKTRIKALLILIIGFAVGYFVYASQPTINKTPHHVWTPKWVETKSFKLGLDLKGGSHLVYKADVSKLQPADVGNAMSVLRDIIERRVNLFGVSEPLVQIQKGSSTNGGEERLIVDLPGITDVSKAVEMIGQTPLLEFKTKDPNPKPQTVKVGKDGKVDAGTISLNQNDQYITTELSGRYLKKAVLEFSQTTPEPTVSLEFNDEGAKLFEEITKANVGKQVAIFLDGAIISAPTVNEAITGGKAVISGNFTPQEAKALVNRLNSGALPVPIELISTQTIGASLGSAAVHDGVRAGMFGFLAIVIFLIIWYRLPGLVAVISLLIYVAIVLAIFKLIPVTLTAAGVAGFIISLGIAVDANVLIFERLKEELNGGRSIADATKVGFERAWTSIRDSNISTIITAIILYAFGTMLIKGFALTLIIGVLVSMFSAIVVSRIFLYSINIKKDNKFTRFIVSSGFTK